VLDVLDALDAFEIVIELCIDLLDFLTDESLGEPLSDSTNQGPIRIFPVYGGRFTDPLRQQDPGSFHS
jgi:hypothetical protein